MKDFSFTPFEGAIKYYIEPEDWDGGSRPMKTLYVRSINSNFDNAVLMALDNVPAQIWYVLEFIDEHTLQKILMDFLCSNSGISIYSENLCEIYKNS